MHQGHWDTRPGLYHINAVDTVTPWQVVGCVKTISERHLVPVLKAMLHPVPLSSERLPLRQRLGVPESPRGPGITGERTRA